MKQFKRHKTLPEVLAQCIAAGIHLNANRYELGGDHVEVWLPGHDGEAIPVLYALFNGRFFYAGADDATYFSSDEDRDGEPWFAAMMDFFYTDTPIDLNAPVTIPVTLQLSQEVVCDLLTVAANCRKSDKANEGFTSHGALDVVRLLTMLAEDAAMCNSRPGSWEGAHMQNILAAHGYH